MDGKSKEKKQIFILQKRICEKISTLLGLKITAYTIEANDKLDNCVKAKVKNEIVATIGTINKKVLEQF